MNDTYRRQVAAADSEKLHKQYDDIVSDGDIVSKHNFRLPETIQLSHAVTQEELNHLFDEYGTLKG